MRETMECPTDLEVKNLVEKCIEDLHSYETDLPGSPVLQPNICAVCDSIPHNAEWHAWVDLDGFKQLCRASALEKSRVCEIYPEPLLRQYTCPQMKELEEFILSPRSVIDSEKRKILVCRSCYKEMDEQHQKIRYKRNKPPREAIANGYIIGETPEVLKCLNPVELSLVCKAQTYCQTWMFRGGQHQQIKGWHTFFKNRTEQHMGCLKELQWAELKGNILVVICGPFTKTQKALTMEKVLVDPEKVVKAYQWLIDNNYHYHNERVPEIDEIPVPYIFEENV